MHWQFGKILEGIKENEIQASILSDLYAGGNLKPLQMVCEVDWKECPKAIVNYIWSEIVTDVLDCLKNEWIAWRVQRIIIFELK